VFNGAQWEASRSKIVVKINHRLEQKVALAVSEKCLLGFVLTIKISGKDVSKDLKVY
jgi:hypothetical protein